jgi:hypothetical protein
MTIVRSLSPASMTLSKSHMEGRYAFFLEHLSAKGRATVQKFDDSCATGGTQGYGELWKRFAGWLGTLAPYAIEMVGTQAVRFHIADGKYKQQVFTLEHTKDGTLVVHLPDVAALAVKRKILAHGSGPHLYEVLDADKSQIQLDLVTAESPDLTICKPMLGWGRRALRAELTTLAKDYHVTALERLCALAAEKWAVAPVAS